MTARANSAAPDGWAALPTLFAFSFGAFLGLALLKFGNPPIMEKYTARPTDIYEFLLSSPWPIAWAYQLLALVGVVGLLVARRNSSAPGWLIAMPLVWLFWQLLATTQSLAARLSNPTLAHFTACLACFYLGLFALSRVERLAFFWLGLLGGFLLMLAVGWQQHFGGLEQTRQYFYLYILPQTKEVPTEYLNRLKSDRIFATLFYPNALAGALLLLFPPMLGFVWSLRRLFTAAAHWFLVDVLSVLSLGCLYWSGSKGGWLLMLTLGAIAFLRLPFGQRHKAALVIALVLLGGTGFFVKYSGFFQKGATSVVARFDYWRAAIQIAAAHPFLGEGPGTFAISYEKIKRPEAEMSRLVHNDYLEQASESGIPGFLVYTAFIVGVLVQRAPWRQRAATLACGVSKPPTSDAGYSTDWLAFSVWLGALGWALQGLFEFGLYLPALAWPAFALLGWLAGHREESATKGNREHK